MARRNNNVDASVTITLNGEQAKNVMDELKKKAEGLRAKIAELQKAAVPDTKAIGKLQKELNATEKSIKSATTQTKKYEETLKKLDKASIKELTAAQRALLAQIKQLTPGTKEFIAATEGYKKVTARINSLNAAYKQVDATQSNIFRRVASGMNRYFLMASTAIASITATSARLRDAARKAAELDDVMSKVMKTTGLTHQQVEELNEAFKKMDTRTSREQLNELAYEAGKLGYKTVESVQQFVEAADIINIALGDVLGEGATLEIAKLATVYAKSTDLIESKDLKGKMMAVGSAINQLGKESTASESYMVDFLGRLGGVAVQANISADQILGYASALDQMKQKVEMSATAFQKLIQQMIKKPEEFVQAARMPLEDFKNLMETDMNGAIKRVLEGFNEMGGFTQLIPIFKDMGLDGARAASVIASLASNLDLVTEAQATANEHLGLGTSMMNEYNIMNESMQAKLDKARKKFHDATVQLGQSLNPVLLKSTNVLTYLIKALAKYGKEIAAAMIAIGAFVAIMKIKVIWMKTVAILNATLKTGTLLLSAAYALLTGNITMATAAWKLLDTAMRTSVIGLALTLFAGLAAVITHWINKTKEATTETVKLTKAQEELQKVDKTASERYVEESSKIHELTGIINNNTFSINKRRAALEELQRIIPEYHAKLTDEGILINNNTAAIDKYLKRLEDQYRLEELVKSRAPYQAQLEKLQAEREEAMKQLNSIDLNDWTKRKDYSDLLLDIKIKYDKPIEEVKQVLKELDTEITRVTDKWKSKKIKTVDIPTYEEALKALENELAAEEAIIKQNYIDGEINQAEYEEAMTDSNIQFLKKKLDLTRQYGEDETKVLAAYLDALVAQQKKVDKELEDIRKKKEAEEEKQRQEELRKEQRHLDELTRLAERFKKELMAPVDLFMEEKKKLDELYEKQMLGNNQAENEENYQKLLLELKKKYAEKSIREIQKIDSLGIFEKYQMEKEALEQFFEEGQMGWEEYERRVKQLRIDAATQTAQAISSTLNNISNLISSMRDMEMAQAEAQYQADLTAAGDNAEERERVENEYQQKQLDIKKKYADVDMAINISKAIAEGALAVARAFADMPYPAAIVVSALIAATTAAQVATIVAQRNAIKNSSVNTSGSTSTGNQNYGDRVITGYKQGGYTDPNADEDEIVGVTHGQEYVIPKWLVKRERVMVRNLEEYRKTGHRPKALSGNGFADGGYTSPPTTAGSGLDQKMMDSLNKLEKAINKMVDEGVPSFMSYKQFNDFINQHNRFKKITSRKP